MDIDFSSSASKEDAAVGHAGFQMLTIGQAATYFNLPRHFVRQLILTGKVPHVKAGKKYLISDKNLELYLNSSLYCDIISHNTGNQAAN